MNKKNAEPREHTPVQTFVFVSGGLVDIVTDRYGNERKDVKIVDWDNLEDSDVCPICGDDSDPHQCQTCGLLLTGEATMEQAILATLRWEAMNTKEAE